MVFAVPYLLYLLALSRLVPFATVLSNGQTAITKR